MSVDESAIEVRLAAAGGWGTCRLAAMRFLTTAPGVLPEVAPKIGEPPPRCAFALPPAATNVVRHDLDAAAPLFQGAIAL
jgi:hypothetical protein